MKILTLKEQSRGRFPFHFFVYKIHPIDRTPHMSVTVDSFFWSSAILPIRDLIYYEQEDRWYEYLQYFLDRISTQNVWRTSEYSMRRPYCNVMEFVLDDTGLQKPELVAAPAYTSGTMLNLWLGWNGQAVTGEAVVFQHQGTYQERLESLQGEVDQVTADLTDHLTPPETDRSMARSFRAFSNFATIASASLRGATQAVAATGNDIFTPLRAAIDEAIESERQRLGTDPVVVPTTEELLQEAYDIQTDLDAMAMHRELAPKLKALKEKWAKERQEQMRIDTENAKRPPTRAEAIETDPETPLK